MTKKSTRYEDLKRLSLKPVDPARGYHVPPNSPHTPETERMLKAAEKTGIKTKSGLLIKKQQLKTDHSLTDKLDQAAKKRGEVPRETLEKMADGKSAIITPEKPKIIKPGEK